MNSEEKVVWQQLVSWQLFQQVLEEVHNRNGNWILEGQNFQTGLWKARRADSRKEACKQTFVIQIPNQQS